MSYLSIGNVKITGISACVPKEVEEVISFLFSHWTTLKTSQKLQVLSVVEKHR